jgi:hypothetical protein
MTHADQELPRRTRRIAVGVGSTLLVATAGVLMLASTLTADLASDDVTRLDSQAIAATSTSTTSPSDGQAATLAYARCMRDHGVDYGSAAYNDGRTPTPRRDDAAFTAADDACRELLVS